MNGVYAGREEEEEEEEEEAKAVNEVDAERNRAHKGVAADIQLVVSSNLLS